MTSRDKDSTEETAQETGNQVQAVQLCNLGSGVWGPRWLGYQGNGTKQTIIKTSPRSKGQQPAFDESNLFL